MTIAYAGPDDDGSIVWSDDDGSVYASNDDGWVDGAIVGIYDVETVVMMMEGYKDLWDGMMKWQVME